MENIDKALRRISLRMNDWEHQGPIPFRDFLKILTERPNLVLRNAFQVFHDMVMSQVVQGLDENPDDPESVHFIPYDCSELFIEDSDNPFFADRLFANRLVKMVQSLKRGTEQNKIYIFEGPPGSGKSTFLNNLLLKFEKYANTEEGSIFETVWRLDSRALGQLGEKGRGELFDRLSQQTDSCPHLRMQIEKAQAGLQGGGGFVDVPCPSHDNPILMIPRTCRDQFFGDLFPDGEFRERLFSWKEFEWVHRSRSCTICSSLYRALLKKVENPMAVLEMVYARPYVFNRRLGQGISVFTPGDLPLKQTILTNEVLQNRINELLEDSNEVRYLFSKYAQTNNGVYALMDIKSNNVERFLSLHNILSEGLHKVEDIEENVHSLFFALMNPEDKTKIQDFQSFSDRIEMIKMPYVLDLNTEVQIYRNVFGEHIDVSFLPRVLHNFARVIISTRLRLHSDALVEWIDFPNKYKLFCDENLHLLKMEIYTGYIPKWLSEEDRKKLTAKRRRRILAESELDGGKGLSGRDSIKIFGEFFAAHARKDKPINMSVLYNYFTKVRKDLGEMIPKGFLDSLMRMYNYTVLQEVKESLYYYNEQQISNDIQDYLFAINFEPVRVERCTYTGNRLEITEEFFASIEKNLMGEEVTPEMRKVFRSDVQREYASRTLTQEIMSEGMKITETALYKDLFERYLHNIKEKVLEPLLQNENFRRGIKDYGKDAFKTYDKRIKGDVTFLIRNLCEKYHYPPKGAQEVCVYVIDNNLAQEFNKT